MKKANETIVLLGKRRNLYLCDHGASDESDSPLLQARIVIAHNARTGRPIQKTYRGRTAGEIQAQVTQDLADGIILLPDCSCRQYITVGELTDHYLAECSANLRESTLHNYKRHSRLIKEHLGDKSALLLTASQVYSFLLKVKEDSAAGRSSDGVCTANDCLFFLRRVLDYGIRQGNVRVNPCRYVGKLRKVREERLLIDPVRIADYLTVLEDDVFYGDALAVMALTGIRIGEGAGMQMDAVDREAMKLHIKSHMLYTEVDGKYQNVFYQGRKKGDAYSIDLNPLILRYIDRAMQKQQHWKSQSPEKYSNPNNLLFTRSLGQGLVTKTLEDHHQSAAIKAGISELQPHDFRRIVATYIFENTDSISMIQAALGQRDPRVSQMYVHRTQGMDLKIRQCQNEFLDMIMKSDHTE